MTWQEEAAQRERQLRDLDAGRRPVKTPPTTKPAGVKTAEPVRHDRARLKAVARQAELDCIGAQERNTKTVVQWVIDGDLDVAEFYRKGSSEHTFLGATGLTVEQLRDRVKRAVQAGAKPSPRRAAAAPAASTWRTTIVTDFETR